MIVLPVRAALVPADAVRSSWRWQSLAFVWPFTESGVCITLLLTRLPYSGGWLYAADLAGGRASDASA